jgi:hypothetical protein
MRTDRARDIQRLKPPPVDLALPSIARRAVHALRRRASLTFPSWSASVNDRKRWPTHTSCSATTTALLRCLGGHEGA